MTEMGNNARSREWLLRYVLGELSEEDTRQADEQFFSNQEFADSIEETYRDLLDAYAAGEIAGAEKERVERAFLVGTQRVNQLNLVQALEASQKAPATLRLTAPRRWLPRFWTAAVATCAVALAILAVVQARRNSARLAVNVNGPERPSPNTRPAEIPPPPPVQAPAGDLYTILLLPNVSRGESADESFAVPASASDVVFQLVLPADEPGKAFEARLEADGHHNPKTFSNLEIKNIAGQRYVEFHMAAASLPAGNYALQVFDSSVPKRWVEEFAFVIRTSAPTEKR